jgi:hypothetical protein
VHLASLQKLQRKIYFFCFCSVEAKKSVASTSTTKWSQDALNFCPQFHQNIFSSNIKRKQNPPGENTATFVKHL